MFPCLCAAIESKEILDTCAKFGDISGFRRTNRQTMVQFSTADAKAFVKQHPKCEVTFSDRSCVVRVSHVKLLYMNTQESVSVRFLIRITKIIPNITTVRITSRLSSRNTKPRNEQETQSTDSLFFFCIHLSCFTTLCNLLANTV